MTACGGDRKEYLSHLRTLVEKCRTRPEIAPPAPLQLVKTSAVAPAEPPDGWTQLLESMLQLNARLDDMQQAYLSLELRICALEKNAPSPQAWRDLLQGIRSIRNLVAGHVAASSEVRR